MGRGRGRPLAYVCGTVPDKPNRKEQEKRLRDWQDLQDENLRAQPLGMRRTRPGRLCPKRLGSFAGTLRPALEQSRQSCQSPNRFFVPLSLRLSLLLSLVLSLVRFA